MASTKLVANTPLWQLAVTPTLILTVKPNFLQTFNCINNAPLPTGNKHT